MAVELAVAVSVAGGGCGGGSHVGREGHDQEQDCANVCISLGIVSSAATAKAHSILQKAAFQALET